ncbi:MAG: hypothetical protein QM784_13285 [Polyangiaceae bacterium]
MKRWFRDSLHGWPIELAITRGVRLTPGVAVYVERGVLFWIALSDGKLLWHVDGQTDPSETCHGERGQSSLYFVCQGERVSTIHRFQLDRLQRLASVPGKPSVVSTTDFGVVLRGPCESDLRLSARRGVFCAIPSSGKAWDIAVESEANPVFVLLTSDSEAVVLERSSSSEPMRLRRVRIGESTRRRATSLSVVNVALPSGANILPDVTLDEVGLSGYLAYGERLVGFRLGLDGRFRSGDATAPARGAVTHGAFALVPSTSGYAYQSVDGGALWRRVRLPVEVSASMLDQVEATDAPRCSTVGCVLGDYFYLGWRLGAEALASGIDDPFSDVEVPTRLGIPFERRHSSSLSCNVVQASVWRPTGLERSTRTHSETRVQHEIRTDRYSGLLNLQRSHGVGASDTSRANVVQWHLRYFDGLSELPLVRATKATATDAPEGAIESALLPSSLDGSSGFRLSTVFDPGGQDGLLHLSHGDDVQLSWVQPGQRSRVLQGNQLEWPERPTDFVSLSAAAYFIGTGGPSGLFELRNDTVRRVVDVDPRANLRSARLRLVRNWRASKLGFWVSRATHRPEERQWFIYPVDRTTYRIDAPLRIPWEETLHACEIDDDWWLIDVEIEELSRVQLHPVQEEWGGRGRALVLASERGTCVKRILAEWSSVDDEWRWSRSPPSNRDAHRRSLRRFERLEFDARMRSAMTSLEP